MRPTGMVAILTALVLTTPARADGPSQKLDQALASVFQQYRAAIKAKRPADAEKFLRQGLELADKSNHPKWTQDFACSLGRLYEGQNRYTKAEPLFRKALAIAEKIYGGDHARMASPYRDLGSNSFQQGRYAEAESLYKRALAIDEKARGSDDWNVAVDCGSLGYCYNKQGRYATAEPLLRRSLAIRRKLKGGADRLVIRASRLLAANLRDQGKFAEAEGLLKGVLAVDEKAIGPEHPDFAADLVDLGNLYFNQERFAEAGSMYRRALAVREKVLKPDDSRLGVSLCFLGRLSLSTGHHAEAEAYLKRGVAILEKAHGPDHREVAVGLRFLGDVYRSLGRYSEAEPLYRRALAIIERSPDPNSPELAWVLNGLGILCDEQRRYKEAEPLFQRALAIFEKAMGPDHANVGMVLNNLALVNSSEGGLQPAQSQLRRALAIYERVYGADSADAAKIRINLARLTARSGEAVEATAELKRALAAQEKALGPDHPQLAVVLLELARLEGRQGRTAEAESWLDRALVLAERGARIVITYQCHDLRAEIAWKAGRRGEALADLRRALDLAEQARGMASGAEHERAEAFTRYAASFERMLAWQLELGDTGEALATIERAHARSLLDELTLAGSDLQVGRPAAEREQLRRQEAEIRSRLAGLEERLAGDVGDASARARLERDLADARAQLYEHYRDARASSPVVRSLISGGGAIRLSQVQRKLCKDRGLLLVYYFGAQAGYVLAIGPSEARLSTLRVPPDEAKTLGTAPGPLTAKRLQDVLVGDGKGGVVPRLAWPADPGELAARLRALWRVIVPEAQRVALTDGTADRLLVSPDGALALLPFEALVVEGSDVEPQYLLDVGPPVSYGPSATVLISLADRRATPDATGREPVLTVADPNYPGTAPTAAPTTGNAAPARSRFGTAGGRLDRLAYTSQESQWLSAHYKEQGIRIGQFLGPTATEAAVRYWVPGRRVLHLACHGLSDQEYGNFFGALALTPGPRGAADPADDGFLTLPEVYELDLRGYELAILSACQTNYGPSQRGEGTWALSRGFLVAGARRVVASNWLVDDEAAAGEIGAFAAGIARAEARTGPIDYASALQAAKRWARRQDKWKAPYYWASLVLVGPGRGEEVAR